MKLFEKLRWLPIDRPCPGTADVSAKSCVLPMFVGDTPGTSRARSRKLRPFIGRLADLGLRHRARNLAARRLEDGRLADDVDGGRDTGQRKRDRQLERRPHRHVHGARRLGKARHADRDVVVAHPQIGKSKSSVAIGHGFAGQIGFGLTRDHARAGHDRALRIGRHAR